MRSRLIDTEGTGRELVAMMKQNKCELAKQMNVGANSVPIKQMLTSHSQRAFWALDARGIHD